MPLHMVATRKGLRCKISAKLGIPGVRRTMSAKMPAPGRNEGKPLHGLACAE